MNYWWVNHSQTFKSEREGGYIWSPKRNADGSKNQTYDNLENTEIGDLVFSYADTKIGAVGVISKRAEAERKPAEFGSIGQNWGAEGWLVRVDWNILDNPIRPKDYINTIAPLLPEKHSPIQNNGNGNQRCYLAHISGELGDLLIELTQNSNSHIESMIQIQNDVLLEDRIERSILEEDIEQTEKEQLIKARIGQGIFRNRLEAIEKSCRVTKMNDKRLLIASHIKPWRYSSNAEKLDGNNGLLLSPHIDKLFDKGWITFTDEGNIIINETVKQVLLEKWGISVNINVGSFNINQKRYLKYHRDNIFKR